MDWTLAHVRDEEITGHAVKTGPEWIAESDAPDFVAGATGPVDQGIAVRDGVIATAIAFTIRGCARAFIDINSNDLAKQGREGLGTVAGIIGTAAVTHGNVQEAINWAEVQSAGVVIGKRLLNRHQDIF